MERAPDGRAHGGERDTGRERGQELVGAGERRDSEDEQADGRSALRGSYNVVAANGGSRSSRTAIHGTAMPSATPPVSSATIWPAWTSCRDTTAKRTTTTGSARPSLTPLSTFNRCRSRCGTSWRPTSAAANTGSVGLSDRAEQERLRPRQPDDQMRQRGRQRQCQREAQEQRPDRELTAGRRSAAVTLIPSLNSTLNSASSAKVATIGSPALHRHHAEHAVAEQETGHQEQHCGRQDAAVGQRRQQHRRQQRSREGHQCDDRIHGRHLLPAGRSPLLAGRSTS